MALDYISIAISFIIVAVYLAVFFFLTEIKRMVDRKTSEIVVYATLSIITLILLRFQSILSKANLLNIPYSQETLGLILSILIFSAIFTLYKGIAEIAGRKEKKGKLRNKKITTRRKSIRNVIVRQYQNFSGKSRISNGYLDLTK